jgi:DNA polymerase III epsilon subunit-like protein
MSNIETNNIIDTSINSNISVNKTDNKNLIMVFDTETTGLPVFKKRGTSNFHPPEDYIKYNKSRLIELGYYIYNSSFEIVKNHNMLVIPNGFLIENTEIHGITNQYAKEKGLPLIKVLEEFSNDLAKCDTIVAHNLDFDYNIVLSECHRINIITPNNICVDIIDKIKKIKLVCTMKLAVEKLKLTKTRIKLIDLYKIASTEEWKQQHRAEDDARVCGICYKYLVNL